ncbi:hypothetical protein [Clostridium senegalense]|uniref:hypothetical protein n=1 Tax=Clostridium senegalense TaxID=1465809 RepID=UPI000288925E|nr:hypothetical protein [Clostridium senegalense]
MKMKKLGIQLLTVAMLVGTTTSVFASSQGGENIVDKISAKIGTYAEGKAPEMPKDAIQLEKSDVNSDNEEILNGEVKTYKQGEMPEKPEGAVEMNKQIIEN